MLQLEGPARLAGWAVLLSARSLDRSLRARCAVRAVPSTETRRRGDAAAAETREIYARVDGSPARCQRRTRCGSSARPGSGQVARMAAPLRPALHDHSASLRPLVDLLKPFLPRSLPLYSTLLTPGVPLAVYATFAPGAVPHSGVEEPWLVVADLGNQLRFFCPVEAQPTPSPLRVKHAQVLVGIGLELYLRHHDRKRDRASSSSCSARRGLPARPPL